MLMCCVSINKNEISLGKLSRPGYQRRIGQEKLPGAICKQIMRLLVSRVYGGETRSWMAVPT